jgi:hypothetical protein
LAWFSARAAGLFRDVEGVGEQRLDERVALKDDVKRIAQSDEAQPRPCLQEVGVHAISFLLAVDAGATVGQRNDVHASGGAATLSRRKGQCLAKPQPVCVAGGRADEQEEVRSRHGRGKGADERTEERTRFGKGAGVGYVDGGEDRVRSNRHIMRRAADQLSGDAWYPKMACVGLLFINCLIWTRLVTRRSRRR